MRTSNTGRESSVEELVFSTTDASYPFVALSRDMDCEFHLEKMLPRSGGRFAEFFSVEGADPRRAVERATCDDRVETRLVASHETGGLVEFVVSGDCPARDLSELGAIPREVSGTCGDGRIVIEIPPEQAAVEITEAFLERHPTVELAAKREIDRVTPMFTAGEFKHLVNERLTERQREVLSLAYESGYYDRPRETTGEELAAALDINPSTFAQHIRAAERNLLSVLYESSQ